MTKPLAVVSNYLALIEALRARVLELGISFETIDQVAGWTDKYASKLLAEPTPGSAKRCMGPMSFDAMLGALAVKLQVIADPEMLRYLRRNRYFVHRERSTRMPAPGSHGYVVHRTTYQMLRQMAPKGGVARAAKMTPRQRSIAARRAALARWSGTR
jgi:hypothetical protein